MQKGRWSRYGISKRSLPRGDASALRQALKVLGPANKGEHQPKSLIWCACGKCAEEYIRDCASDYNSRLILVETAPRKKAVVLELKKVAKRASDLAQALVALDDISRTEISRLDPIDYVEPGYSYYKKAKADALPQPDTEDKISGDGAWVEKLRALRDHVQWRVEGLTGWDEDDPIHDKGGNTNIYREREGSPVGYLVRECWFYFHICRPYEATSTEDGPFSRFVHAVHEYATGSREESSTVQHWIKKLAKPLRLHDLELRKYGAIERRIDDVIYGRMTKTLNSQVKALQAELLVQGKVTTEALLALNTILRKQGN